MTTRRGFLKGAGAAGIAFCSCGMLDAARAQQPGAPRLPVTVNGKRVKTIDVHSHCLFHEAVDLMGDEARGVFGAGQRRREPVHRHRRAAQADGRDGDRHGGALHQSVLVSQGPRHRGGDRQAAEREARRAVRGAAGALRRLCLARPAVSRSRGATARGCREEAGPARRRHRRQRCGRGLLRPQIPPGVGQGRGARRGAVHSPAEHAGARQALQGQRLAVEHHRQPARHHHRPAAPDLRGHARPLPGPEDARRARRRLSRLLRAALATTPASWLRRGPAIPTSS